MKGAASVAAGIMVERVIETGPVSAERLEGGRGVLRMRARITTPEQEPVSMIIDIEVNLVTLPARPRRGDLSRWIIELLAERLERPLPPTLKLHPI